MLKFYIFQQDIKNKLNLRFIIRIIVNYANLVKDVQIFYWKTRQWKARRTDKENEFYSA